MVSSAPWDRWTCPDSSLGLFLQVKATDQHGHSQSVIMVGKTHAGVPASFPANPAQQKADTALAWLSLASGQG